MILSLIVVLGCAIVGLLYQTRALRRYRSEGARLVQNGRELSERVMLLEQELAALCGASAGATHKLAGLEQRMRRIRQRQNQLESQARPRPRRTQAAKPAAFQSEVDELVETRGLTRAEAELLLMKPRGNA